MVKLSVIMPLFNVEKTLAVALDSVLMQQVDFIYEVIAIDDKSTDSTLSILQDYAQKYPQIKVIQHTENQGNAISFYDGLADSKGKYFCVLDGDDYYTIKNKLQKQVNFLDGDKDENYTAVAHKYLKVNDSGDFIESGLFFSSETEYGYECFLQQKFYFHTSTYMYRNIFRGNVPLQFREAMFRGDNPRTFLHLIYTKGKIKILNFVGSVYCYSRNGIWSTLSAKQQRERQVEMYTALGELLTSDVEKNYWNQVSKVAKRAASNVVQISNFCTVESYLQKLRKLAIKYAYSQGNFVFEFLCKSEFIDSFCESLGYVEKVRRHISLSSPLETNPNHILITISNLTSQGGGIYYEIKDIIEMYADKKVFLLWTDVDDLEHLDAKVREQFAQYPQLTHIFGKSDEIGKVKKLFDIVIKVAPAKIYHYLGHDNVYAVMLVQSGISKNICIFSYDHGFSLGLDNTAYDIYIAKRPTDYEMLKNKYGDKVIYIPCWNSDKMLKNKYVPFNSHKKIITACAAARFYKLTGAADKNYVDFILASLQITHGKHIHYGCIPDADLAAIKTKIRNLGLSEEQFVNIPWADNLSQSMYDNHVDLFIEPFPVVSYKITLDVLSAGIPILINKADKRMNMVDFIYESPLSWKTKADFLNCIKTIDEKELKKHSILSRKYYGENHLPSVLQSAFVQEKSFTEPKQIRCLDNRVVEISSLDRMLIEDTIEELGLITSSEKTKGLQIKKRIKNIYYLSQLLLAQVPIIDWAFKKKKRKKILAKILKHWR